MLDGDARRVDELVVTELLSGLAVAVVRATLIREGWYISSPRAVRTRRQGAAPFSPVRLNPKTAVYNCPPVEATPVARRATVDTGAW